MLVVGSSILLSLVKGDTNVYYVCMAYVDLILLTDVVHLLSCLAEVLEIAIRYSCLL
jgi:hypothetical protein